jgi:hypothetical protein
MTAMFDGGERASEEETNINTTSLVILDAGVFDSGWSWSEMTRREKLCHASPSKIVSFESDRRLQPETRLCDYFLF